MKRYYFSILIVFILCNLQLYSDKPSLSSYIRTWPLGTSPLERSKGNYWSADDINGQYLDKLVIAFARFNSDSTIYINDVEVNKTSSAGFTNFETEVKKLKEKYPELKISLAIGGWGADGFSQMAKSKSRRKKFITSVIKKIDHYGFDSIDINWLYPVNGAGGVITSSPQDKSNFTILLKELDTELEKHSKKIGRDLEISIAIGAIHEYIDWVEVDKILDYVDAVKVLTYDFYGSWSETTGHISNLYDSYYNQSAMSVDEIITYFDMNGIDKSKIIMGVPLYGRVWTGVDKANNGLYQSFKEVMYPDGIGYDKIEGLMELGLTRFWDERAAVPYLYNGDILVSYEDRESLLEKVKYVKANGMRGITFWEYAHNLNGNLIKDIYTELKK